MKMSIGLTDRDDLHIFNAPISVMFSK